MSAATLHQVLGLISPLYIVAGTLAGYLVGIIPGLGPAAGITLLLPLTYYMSPAEAHRILQERPPQPHPSAIPEPDDTEDDYRL